MSGKDTQPWYREPWPWLLMAGPFVVVIAGIYTAWLAISTSDGLVADDYYKRGLAANQTIARSERAQALGLAAHLRTTGEGFAVRLVAQDKAFAPPPTLTVTLSHPTRAGLDQTQTYPLQGDTYAGRMRLPASGHWLVLIEDDARSWRLMGNVVLPASGETVIGGAKPADIRN